jgi:hypothetical protein
LHHARLHAHGVLEAGERVLPTRLSAGEELLRGGRAGIALRITLRERLIDRSDVVGDALGLGEELLGLLIDCSSWESDEYGRLARFFAWLTSMLAWFSRLWIWLLTCCRARAAVSTFCEKLVGS